MSLQMFSKKDTNKKQLNSQDAEKSIPAKKMEAPVDLRTPAKAKSWVSSLPLTDMGETTRRLYAGL